MQGFRSPREGPVLPQLISMLRGPLHHQTECARRKFSAVDGDRVNREERGR